MPFGTFWVALLIICNYCIYILQFPSAINRPFFATQNTSTLPGEGNCPLARLQVPIVEHRRERVFAHPLGWGLGMLWPLHKKCKLHAVKSSLVHIFWPVKSHTLNEHQQGAIAPIAYPLPPLAHTCAHSTQQLVLLTCSFHKCTCWTCWAETTREILFHIPHIWSDHRPV